MNQTLEILFGLFGGLAIFIFGMNMMSECLQKAAGEKMKAILGALTRNPVMGVLAGALTTAVLQSSSATTVMVIGFVSAGLMTLPQAIAVVFGANIGTTITAQIIAFQITDYIYLIIFVGFLVSFIVKSEKIKNIGQTIFAFGLLFLGIETMGDVMKPLASSPIFLNMIEEVSHIPILGVVVGTLMTLVVQSSSATIAVLQNFAAQPAADGVNSILGLAGAIPILLGDNIGTTITAILASIGQSKNAKRTAVAHCIFNVSGCFLFIWFINPYAQFISWISPKGPEVEVISRQIANAHTTFNVVMTFIWMPLIWLMVKIVMRLLPDKKQEMVNTKEPLYLDSKMASQPAAALEMVAREILRCSDIVGGILKEIKESVKNKDKKLLAKIQDESDTVSNLYNKIVEYLSNLFSSGVLTEEQATQSTGLMYVLSDIDRIGNLCVEVGTNLKENLDQRYEYSEEALEDVSESLHMIGEIYEKAIQLIKTGDIEGIQNIMEKKEKIQELDLQMRKSHMMRVSEGKCKAELTSSFAKILHGIDRMKNSCTNIADIALQKVNVPYFIRDTKKSKKEA